MYENIEILSMRMKEIAVSHRLKNKTKVRINASVKITKTLQT